MKITILIPIHNRIEITKIGLNSISKSLNHYLKSDNQNVTFNIIIIDDGSNDGSSIWISENYPNITIIKGDGNLWWAGAINEGAKYSIEKLNSNYILLWNDDTICSKDYFIQLNGILQFSKYQDAILVSKIYWKDEPSRLFNFGCYYNRKTGKKTINGYNKINSEEFNSIINIDWSGGMGTLIPARIIKSLNFFDAVKFPQYHSDSDFCLRAIKEGYKIYAIPSLKIWNDQNTSGISTVKKISDLANIITSTRSFYNLKQNYQFNRIHSNTVFSWIRLINFYIIFFFKSVIKIIIK